MTISSGRRETDQVLHLLHDSRAGGFTATLHQWQDFRLMMTHVPDGLRRLGFGAVGSFMDAASEQVPTVHKVSRLSFDGSGRYRLEPARSPESAEGSSRPGGVTAVGDGRRHWQIFGDEWHASADGLPPDGLAKVLGASRLLEHRLYGGAETTVGGRRGYRLRVAPDGPATLGMPFADDVVADAELGILLRVICHAGSKVETWYELRDVVAGGDIRIDIPEEARTAYDDLYGPEVSPGRRLASLIGRQAAKDARSAFRNVFGGRRDLYDSSPYRSCHRRPRNASLLPSSYWTALASSSSGSRLGSASIRHGCAAPGAPGPLRCHHDQPQEGRGRDDHRFQAHPGHHVVRPRLSITDGAFNVTVWR